MKADAGVDTQRVSTSSRQEGDSIVLQSVESAARQLVELCLYYLVGSNMKYLESLRRAAVPWYA